MQRLEGSGAVRSLKWSLGVEGLIFIRAFFSSEIYIGVASSEPTIGQQWTQENTIPKICISWKSGNFLYSWICTKFSKRIKFLGFSVLWMYFQCKTRVPKIYSSWSFSVKSVSCLVSCMYLYCMYFPILHSSFNHPGPIRHIINGLIMVMFSRCKSRYM